MSPTNPSAPPISTSILSPTSPSTLPATSPLQKPQQHLPSLASTLSQPEQQTGTPYTGHCHCGRLTYLITIPAPLTDPSTNIEECDCSICTRNAYLLLRVLDGEEEGGCQGVTFLNEGSWESGRTYTTTSPPHGATTHLFCPTCGTKCLTETISTPTGPPPPPTTSPSSSSSSKSETPSGTTTTTTTSKKTIKVNVRTLEGVDIAKLVSNLRTRPFEGY